MAISREKPKNSAEGDTFGAKLLNLRILIEHILKLPGLSGF
jgi:hypothetical protein